MKKRLKIFPVLLAALMIFSCFPYYASVAAAPSIDIGSDRVNIENDSNIDSYIDQAPMVIGDKLHIPWYDYAANAAHYSVINANGTIGSLPPITISPKTNNNSDTILYKSLSTGNIVIYWYSGSSGTGLIDTYFKIVDQSWNEVVGATKINSNTVPVQYELNRFTEVAELSNGNLAFVWAVDGSNYALRRFKTDGTAVDPAQLNVTTLAGISGSQYTHNIVADNNGRFMIMISYYNPDYRGMIFDNDSSTPVQVGGLNSFVIASRAESGNEVQRLKLLPNGKFLAVYQKITGAPNQTNTRSVAYRIYNADGTPYTTEKVIRVLNSWGSIRDPIILADGFILSYAYNDLNTPGSYREYLEYYDDNGVFQSDLSTILPPVNGEYGAIIPFQDIDGKLSLLINDTEGGQSTYNAWLIRHAAAPTEYTVTFQDWNGTVLKTETVNHGSNATAPVNPSRAGYTFTGWSAAFTGVTANATITAQYSANQYTVSFNSNDGSAVGSINANFGAKITAPTTPTRDGYNFDGWYKEAGLTNVWSFASDSVPINGITLFAKWTIKTYTVTFKDWDGATIKTEPVNHGSNATAPASPTRTGYTFTGWDAELTGVIASATITAQYSANQYTVSFDSNGGNAVGAINADFGAKITAPTVPTREGYNFDGWYKEAGLTNGWVFASDTVPINGITLFAKWTIKTYTITFKDWDGATLKTEPVNHGSNASAPVNPTRTGYTFTGWSGAFAGVTASATITAQYSVNEYTVSFNSNGGSAVDAIDADYGTKIAEPAVPTREGYNFDGWYKEAGLTNAWVFASDTVPANDITLFAKWTIKTYTITFKDWDGATLKTEPVNHGGNATAPTSPSRTGHTFTGWDAGFTGVTVSATITAQYSVNEYTVSFNSNGGNEVNAIDANFGTTITAPTVPTREGYNFDGWYKEAGLTNTWLFASDTVPANDITLFAKWTIKTYTITFKDWDGATLKTEPVNHGGNATAPVNPSRTGHTFTGWDAGFTGVTASATITAQYSVNEYTVSFNSNGGSTVDAIDADYGTKIVEPAVPTREGYNFDGWYQEAGLTNAWAFASDTVPANDITLFAKWTIKTYTVTFKDWDGATLKTEPVNHGSNATAPTSPARTGYTFTGWSGAFAGVTASATITAQYSVNEYTVSFNSSGGSTVDAIYADYGSKIVEPALPTREGYNFDGWYQEVGLTNAWVFASDTVPANDITLFAKWTIKVYTVTFLDWDETELKNVLVNHGSDANAPVIPARAGYTFTNWNAALTNVTANITFTAQYSANEYTVSFNSNGGSTVDATNADFGTKITAPTAPTREGYRLEGWYKEVDLTNDWSFDTDTVPVDGITLYAKWTAVYMITYNGNESDAGNVPLDSTAYEHESSVTVLGNAGSLIRSGYNFAGWNTQADGKGLSYAPSVTFEIDHANVTLYAVWNKVPDVPIQTGPSTTTIEVLINGKIERIGTAASGTRNGQTVTTVTVDQKGLDERLAAVGQHAVLTIPVDSNSDIIIGQFNGQMIKNLENKLAVLEIKTGLATYTLPALQINMDSISNQLGKTVALQDIVIQIEIAEPTAEMMELAEIVASRGSFKLVMPPIDFKITATYEGETVEVSKFSAYVERAVEVPDGVDPKKITTGIVVESDGTVRHVPTQLVVIDGKNYVKLSSLTNSTYSIIWNPLEFSDVSQHWAKDDVNDMGSRMIISGIGNGLFNPDQAITRAEFTAIIVRGLGLKLEEGTSPYSDVKAESWYNSAINTASAYNLITGFEDGTFRPNDKITREQAMVIISKAMTLTSLKAKLPVQSTDITLGSFEDAAEAASWAQSSIADSVQAGIVSGRSSSKLAPKDNITRAEVASIMKRLLQKSELI